MATTHLSGPATIAEQRRNLSDWRYLRSYLRHLTQARVDASSWETKNAHALLAHSEARIARAAYDIALHGHSKPMVRVAYRKVGRAADQYAGVRDRELRSQALAEVVA